MAETYEQVERERDSMRMRLIEWNALALAGFSLDSSALWPNGWRQEVAQVAWALHDAREQLAASQREREQLQEALRASRKADEAQQDADDLLERAIGEGWDNDPTGSSHLFSARERARLARETFIALRDAALSPPAAPVQAEGEGS